MLFEDIQYEIIGFFGRLKVNVLYFDIDWCILRKKDVLLIIEASKQNNLR
jgi:hypothetical protein